MGAARAALAPNLQQEQCVFFGGRRLTRIRQLCSVTTLTTSPGGPPKASQVRWFEPLDRADTID